MRRRLFYGTIVSFWVILISYITIKVSHDRGPWGLGSSVSNGADVVILAAAGVVVGILLLDPKRILYAYVAVTVISIVLSLVVSTCIDWFILGNNVSFGLNPYGLQWTAYFALLRIFRAIFPAGVIISFLSAFAGGVVGALLGVDRFLTDNLERPLP